MLYGFIIGVIVVIGLVIYAVERKAYLKRKELGLKLSVAGLANKEAAKVTGAVQGAADKVTQDVTKAAGKVS